MFGHANQPLTQAQKKARDEAVERCRDTQKHETVYCPNGEGDAYAYPGSEGKIHWGVNGSHGCNIARDITPG